MILVPLQPSATFLSFGETQVFFLSLVFFSLSKYHISDITGSTGKGFVRAILCDGIDLLQRDICVALQIGRHGGRKFLKLLNPIVLLLVLRLVLRAQDAVGDDVTAAVAVSLLRNELLGLILVADGRRRWWRPPIVVDADDLNGIAAAGTEAVAAQQDGERLAEVGVEGVDDGVE